MNKLVTFGFSLFLICNSISYASEPAPEVCPSLSAIQQVLPVMAFKDEEGEGYSTFAMHHYDTDFMWGFVIADIKDAHSEEEALANAIHEMQHSLDGNPYPLAIGDDLWLCIYSIGKGYTAAAIEPLPMGAKNALSLTRHYTR